MIGKIVHISLGNVQDGLAVAQDKLRSKSPLLGLLAVLPVAILDVSIETIKTPLKAIEQLALAAINLIGAAFSHNCTLRGADYSLTKGLYCLADTPVAILLAPLRLVQQLEQIFSREYVPVKNCYLKGYELSPYDLISYPTW
jgi:hypothetical protein